MNPVMTCLMSSVIGEDDSGMIQPLSAISQPRRVLKPEDMQITRLYSLSLFISASIKAQFSLLYQSIYEDTL